MERPAHHAHGDAAPIQARDHVGQGKMPPSSLRNALQIIHVGLLFNEEEGLEVNTVLLSVREELGISPRLALAEALRSGLVEECTDSLGRACVRRGPRSDEVLRRVYGRGSPPTREGLMARARAWDEYLEARRARLEAIREAARPKEHNTAASLPAWMH